MVLRELNLGDKTKCSCKYCQGTGIEIVDHKSADTGIICRGCHGKGYNTLKLDNELQLVQDEKTNIVYKVVNGLIVGTVDLFEQLVERDDTNYVIYYPTTTVSVEYLFEHCIEEDSIIKYEDFLEGKLPLPISEKSCPREITFHYRTKELFSNVCFSCKDPVHLCQECWDKFYGEAKTKEEKQKVLQKIR